VEKSDLDLARHGDDLVVTVGSYRRLIALPTALGKHAVSGARIDDGELRVRFTPVADEASGPEGTDGRA